MNTQMEELLATFRRAEFPEFMGQALDNPFVRCSYSGDTLLHFVAVWGDVEAARLLLDLGVEIDLPGEDDFTALHNAISQEHLQLVKLLLARGADPFKRCMFGDAFEMVGRKQDPAFRGALDEYIKALPSAKPA